MLFGKFRDSIYLPLLSNSDIILLTMPFSIVRQKLTQIFLDRWFWSLVLVAVATQFMLFFSSYYIGWFPILSCTKMCSVSSVPYDIWDNPLLVLTWSKPKCGHCEVKGEKCRFKSNSTDFRIECFNPDKNKGIVFYPISTFMSTQVLHV